MTDTPRTGRPRRADVEQRVLDATVSLVAENGYAATTLDGIARRAGAAKTTLYRRWDSKALIAVDALAAALGDPPVPDDETRAAVAEPVRWLVGRIRRPAVRALLLGLVDEAARDREVRAALRGRIRTPFTIRVAAAWGLPPPRVDLAFDVAVGTLLHRVAMTGACTPADAAAVADLTAGLLLDER